METTEIMNSGDMSNVAVPEIGTDMVMDVIPVSFGGLEPGQVVNVLNDVRAQDGIFIDGNAFEVTRSKELFAIGDRGFFMVEPTRLQLVSFGIRFFIFISAILAAYYSGWADALKKLNPLTKKAAKAPLTEAEVATPEAESTVANDGVIPEVVEVPTV